MSEIQRVAGNTLALREIRAGRISDGMVHANVDFQFARDSPLEGDGFEPSVPRKWDNAFRVSRVLRAAPNVAPAVGDARCFDKSPV
jgi:hypothetical protein